MLVRQHGIAMRMSDVSKCSDKAPIKRLCATLQTKLSMTVSPTYGMIRLNAWKSFIIANACIRI